MSTAVDFSIYLQSRLQQGTKVRVYHVLTSPTSSPPLFAPAPGQLEEATTTEFHFLSLSQPWSQPDGSGCEASHILVLGIEVLVITSIDLTTIFVSKADSTGFIDRRFKGSLQDASLAQVAITAFLDFLLNRCQGRGRVVLSLFARSQNQYLFPGSIENPTKHVLDDRQLVKWWCRVLDPLARNVQKHTDCVVKAYVVVPGCDSGDTKAFFPLSTRSDPPTDPLWTNAYPVSLLVKDISLPPRCLVPRLPDDPKSRFLDDLDSQCDQEGNWRGIKNLDQFWEMMSYRQECSAGRLVGFIWVVVDMEPPNPVADKHVNDEPSVMTDEQTAKECQAAAISVSNVTGPLSSNEVTKIASSILSNAAQEAGPPPLPISSSTIPTQSQPAPEQSRNDRSDPTTGDRMPEPGPCKGLLLTADEYQVLMDELLSLDFAGETLAVHSSQKWCEKAARLASVSHWGVDIEGAVPSHSQSNTVNDARGLPAPAINVLTGVRRKRKKGLSEDLDIKYAQPEAMVNTLTTNLLRKRPKPRAADQ